MMFVDAPSNMSIHGPSETTVRRKLQPENSDIAWHPAWMNTEQTRAFEIDGDLHSISTVRMVHPNFPGRAGQAVVRWRRMSE